VNPAAAAINQAAAGKAGPVVPPADSEAPARVQVAQAASQPSIDVHRLMAVLQNPYADEGTKQIAQKLLMQQFAEDEFSSGPQGIFNKRTGAIVNAAPDKPEFTSGEQGIFNRRTGEVKVPKEEKKQFTSVKDANGNEIPVVFNPSTGAYELKPLPQSEQSQTVTGPDGKPIAIPPGVDRKTFVNEVSRTNADAATGKMTEVQAKASQFATRMEAAENTLKGGLSDQALGLSGAAQQVAGGVPVIGSALQSGDYQKYDQAKRQFVTALLRQESGAAISKSEFERYDKEMFPQPGDKPEVIAQKAETRKLAVEEMKRAAGPGYKPHAPAETVGKPKEATPDRSAIEAEMKRRGLIK
jgi:hypothetical protein